jgi:hypothetical protein
VVSRPDKSREGRKFESSHPDNESRKPLDESPKAFFLNSIASREGRKFESSHPDNESQRPLDESLKAFFSLNRLRNRRPQVGGLFFENAFQSQQTVIHIFRKHFFKHGYHYIHRIAQCAGIAPGYFGLITG